MTSSISSFSRDEAAANSPLRNAFASSSTKPLHSPFLARRARTSADTQYTRLNASNQGVRQPDAISTSSSTLVNAESTSDYRPWEVRSNSGASTSSLDSLTGEPHGRATPTLSALEDIGTLPSIHISPLPTRSAQRATTAANPSTRSSNDSTARRSIDSSLTKARPARQLCPDDCRCSDQDIDLGLCRRVVGSSSSASESGSLSVGVHPMRRRAGEPSSLELAGSDADGEMSHVNGLRQGDHSQQSWRSISEPRSQGRDFEKDPILVPRSARSRGSGEGRRSSISSHQRSYDQLQRGLDTLDSNESEADSDAEQVQAAAQRRAESMARWTARRLSLSQSNNDRRSTVTKLESGPVPHAPTKSSPMHSATRSLASDASIARRTSDSKQVDESASPLLASPLKATPGRKSIAAVFESMQKEREARAAEEHKQWQEKQARRERERAARAFGVPLRRRTSASSSAMGSPVSASLAPDTPASQGQTTAFHSMVSRSPVIASPLLSSPGSPKVDESAAADVQPQHLGEEAAGRIPETLTEAEEIGEDAQEEIERSPEASQAAAEQPAAALPTTPQTKHTHAFGFASRPMALDLSPVRSSSEASSPASSPRKMAHRRQNTNTISVAARLPTASIAAARQRFDSVLGSEPRGEAHDSPRTPVGGILSSAKKQLSAARRGHSVRFSPRPDYRSDSGSWDDSGTQQSVDEREAAVSRLLLPAKQIRIPDILASSAAVEEEQERSEASEAREEATSVETISKAHIPSVDTTATSFSVRFPGAYAPTPQKYSRHVVRPSPKISRVLPHTIPAAIVPSKQYGVFPTFGASIPRESTPPPVKSEMLPPDDARNSPRSPRPVDLGREGFARFDAGSASSVDSSPEVVDRAVDRTKGDVGVTIGRILRTVEAANSGKVKRLELGERLSGVGERVAGLGGPVERRVRPSRVDWEQDEQQDRMRVDQVKQEVMQALALLADRLVNSPTDIVAEPARRRLSRRTTLLLVLLQCALIAWLMSLAERRAERMRMYQPSPQLAVLYSPAGVQWTTVGDANLQPLLQIPGLTHMWHSFPPPPSMRDGWWSAYRSYARLNGAWTLTLQLAVYVVSQTLAYALLVALAPIQLLRIVVMGAEAEVAAFA